MQGRGRKQAMGRDQTRIYDPRYNHNYTKSFIVYHLMKQSIAQEQQRHTETPNQPVLFTNWSTKAFKSILQLLPKLIAILSIAIVMIESVSIILMDITSLFTKVLSHNLTPYQHRRVELYVPFHTLVGLKAWLVQERAPFLCGTLPFSFHNVPWHGQHEGLGPQEKPQVALLP